MREPFAYESNVELVRQFLVPDPLSPGKWDKGEQGWRRHGAGKSLLEWLVETGLLPEREMLEAFAGVLGTGYLLEKEYRLESGATPEEQMLEANGFLVVRSGTGRRHLCGGPNLPPDLQTLRKSAAALPPWVLLSPLRGGTGTGSAGSPANRPGMDAWVRESIATQLALGASDIHFERTGDVLKIRVHKGGRMATVGEWSDGRAENCLMILKRWAAMAPAAASLPRDGRILLCTGGRNRILRLSHLTTVDGESAVLRMPGEGSRLRKLDQLGMPRPLPVLLRGEAIAGRGLILVCGSTGSGKTTTAYAVLEEIRSEPLKVLTIEDPVERELDFGVQSAVDLNTGWTFARALKAFLRQDPDLIFLGEMRDRESAEVACRAALTGHGVLATVHAGNIDQARSRLAGWGIPEGLLQETVRLVVHQHLAGTGNGRRRAEFKWWRSAGDS